jgi:hypothetical protein
VKRESRNRDEIKKRMERKREREEEGRKKNA